MKSRIQDIAVALPETALTNEELAATYPEWNVELVGKRAGVEKRHVAGSDQTALDLGAQACLALFETHPQLKEQINALLFCTQSADYIMPPNSCVLHGELGLPENVMAYDVNMACSGFVYSLAQADGLIRSGQAKNVLIVNADTYSKYIHPQDRSARVLFGDGASATWVTSDDEVGVQAVLCGTAGAKHDKFIIPAGGCRLPKSAETAVEETDQNGNIRTSENIHMAGRDILAFVGTKVPQNVRQLLKQNELSVEDIDCFFFHQASNMVLDTLARFLKLDATKMFRNLENIGNTVSASIPIALKDAETAGQLKRGDRIVICGFGVGLSWGSILMNY